MNSPTKAALTALTAIMFLLLSVIVVSLLLRQPGEDTEPPVFYGLEDMILEKNRQPDYQAGVEAVDDREGQVDFTWDDSAVEPAEPGIYYVRYTASDSKGNTAVCSRRVEVVSDSADTQRLVTQLALQLEGSAEDIRDYVRTTIAYSAHWGGDDPVWYGLRYKTGNCYVHAMVLDALLREKGYDTRLIWCVDETHYWNMVCLDGVWWHIDSTPSSHTHSKYSLMNDRQRYETLSGRDWDRDQWPACP